MSVYLSIISSSITGITILLWTLADEIHSVDDVPNEKTNIMIMFTRVYRIGREGSTWWWKFNEYE